MVTEGKETKQMQSTFEKLGGTYRQEGDYLLPNVEVPESPAIGIWGMRRLQYLREHKRILYQTMFYTEKLNNHLEEIDQSEEEMFEQLVKQLSAIEGVTEDLKATDQMVWVAKMNNIRSQANEIVYQELIYQ